MWKALNSMRSWLNHLIIENEWGEKKYRLSHLCSLLLIFIPWTSCELGRNVRIRVIADCYWLRMWTLTVELLAVSRMFRTLEVVRGNEPRISVRLRKSDVKTFPLHWRAFIYGGIWARERKRLDGRLILRSMMMIVTQKMLVQVLVAVQEENVISWWQLGQCLYDSSYLARFCPWQPICINIPQNSLIENV